MKKLFTMLAMLMLVLQYSMAGEATLTLNGSAESDPEGFFTWAGDFNSKFNGAEYAGNTFNSGLKMNSSGNVTFTTTKVSTVTIVQSTWLKNNVQQTIKFDGNELSIANATAGTGCLVYTLTDVAAGDHSITKGSDESGLFYVKVEWVDTKTVTFIDDAGWSDVCAYAWNETGDVSASWPGDAMTPVEGAENTYTWTTTGNPTKIIFNNWGSSKTADLDFVDGATYNSQGRVIVLNTYTATINTDLETVYAYTWSGTGSNKVEQLGAWPGIKLEGTNVVSIEAEEAPQYIIFHNYSGDQTADLEFTDGQTYEFYKTTYTATFATDVDWEDVYAYVWTGDGDNATNKALGAWPGTKLEANEGVYTVSFDAYNAPEKIQFNGGSNDKKAGDWTFKDGKAYKYITATPIYAISGKDIGFESGHTELVKDADGDVVATITYGAKGGDDFKKTKEYSIEGYTGYTYYTEGNGTNGDQAGGTFYTIVPMYDGTIDLAVIINAGKTLIVEEDGVAMGGFEKQTEKLYGIQSFTVQAGKSYKCYVSGSKMGFYGFDYKFEKTELAVTDYYLVGGTGDWTVSDAALTKDGDVYSVEVPYESGYSFAIAPNTAILGTIVVDWGKVIRPAAQTEVVFANTTGDASTEDNRQNWKMRTLEDNESNEYTATLKYNAAANTWAIECAATVTISAAGYATYSNAQPYKVEGAEVYTVSEATTKATFNQLPEGAEIPGGTGVILKGEGEVTITPSAGTAEIGTNLLKGSGDYSYVITDYDADAYIFQNGDNGVGFYKVDLATLSADEKVLPAHKAFLKVSGGQAPFFGFDGNGTTGINSVERGALSVEGCYTLDGRRVEQPTKGLYIMNGKKVLVK